MINNDLLEGKFVNLRSVNENDAEFILQHRNNPDISKYLPRLDVSVKQQRDWITKQREDNNSYYFIIQDKASTAPLGTFSVYNIDGNHAEVGRVFSIGDFIQNTEACILLAGFILEQPNLKYVDIWIYKNNNHVLALTNYFNCCFEEEKKDENGRTYLCGRIKIDDNIIKTLEILKKKINGLPI